MRRTLEYEVEGRYRLFGCSGGYHVGQSVLTTRLLLYLLFKKLLSSTEKD